MLNGLIMPGTTPTHIFTIPPEITNIVDLRIVYAQNREVRLTKKMEDCAIEQNTITVTLSQTDTFKFDSGKMV
jgi:hypothetical protein